MADLDKDALEIAARAMQTPEIGSVSDYWMLKAEAGVAAYQSAMEAKRRTPEEVAAVVVEKYKGSHRDHNRVLYPESLAYQITEAIRKDREGT